MSPTTPKKCNFVRRRVSTANVLLLARFKGDIYDACQRRSVRHRPSRVVISRKLSKIDL